MTDDKLSMLIKAAMRAETADTWCGAAAVAKKMATDMETGSITMLTGPQACNLLADFFLEQANNPLTAHD